jgi:hypothetical protein
MAEGHDQAAVVVMPGMGSILPVSLPDAPGRAFAAVGAVCLPHRPLQDGPGQATPDVSLIVLGQTPGQVHAPPFSQGPMPFPWLDPGCRRLRKVGG